MVFYPEELIQMIWKCRLYVQSEISCVHGELLRVIDPGIHNLDAGPDFLQAKLQINEIIWAGQVEVHWQAKNWFSHQHHHDDRYDNVILHVVWEGNCTIERKDGSIIPTLQLSHYVSPDVLQLYHQLQQSKTWIPCANLLKEVPSHLKIQVLDRMIKNRLDAKATYISTLLQRYANDWERVTRCLFAEAFGMRVNKHAFARLIDSLPANIFDRYQDRPQVVASLLFGQAGFLESKLSDDYFLQLQSDYQYLRQLHQLRPMAVEEWRFSRMRPANFPTIRIAQLAAVFAKFNRLFQLIISAEDLPELYTRFADLQPADYWCDHYQFGQQSPARQVRWTPTFLHHITINCFAPLVYANGHFLGQDDRQERAIAWLNLLPAERNRMTATFAELGLPAQHAADSQALLQLYRDYCEAKRCLSCAIGIRLIGRSTSTG